MRILIACEYSGELTKRLRAKGHYVLSCDLLPSEIPGEHYQGDVKDVLTDDFDMMIAFPPCTHLAVSGARWFKYKQAEQKEAIDFFMTLANAPIPKICIENPVGIMSTKYRKPDQIIQPWQHGHGETKATCLWLKGLPLLQPSNIVPGRIQRIHLMPPGPNRAHERSRTYPGIAQSMADQWG